MNEEIKKAKESLKLIHADIEEGMDKKFIDIDLGLELNRLTKPIETALNQAEELQEFTRIVFEKNVFIWGMAYRKKELKDYKPTYEYYKSHCGYFHSGYTWKLMTEKEFDIVKRGVEKYGSH